jgi:hypothetical protein
LANNAWVDIGGFCEERFDGGCARCHCG